MKCYLCNGKGGFLIEQKEISDDPFFNGCAGYIRESCPVCQGKKEIDYINFKKRIPTMFKTYADNYSRLFAIKNTTESQKTILEYL